MENDSREDRLVLSQHKSPSAGPVRKGMQGKPLHLLEERGMWQFLLKYGLQKVIDDAPKFKAKKVFSGDYLHMPEAHAFEDRIGGGVRVQCMETGELYDIQNLAWNAIFPQDSMKPTSWFGVRLDGRGLSERFSDYFKQAPDWTLRFMQEARRIYAERYKHPIPFVLLTYPDIENRTDGEIQDEIQEVTGIKVEIDAIKQARRKLRKRLLSK